MEHWVYKDGPPGDRALSDGELVIVVGTVLHDPEGCLRVEAVGEDFIIGRGADGKQVLIGADGDLSRFLVPHEDCPLL